MPSRGAIAKPCANKRILELASKKFARTRAQLKRHLEASAQCADSDGYICDSIHDKIQQLRTSNLPATYPASWDDGRQIRRRLHPRTYLTPLDEMKRMWSEQELEKEFGLLPGEEAG